MTSQPAVSSFKVGALEVFRIEELRIRLGPSLLSLGFHPEELSARHPWAIPHFVSEAGEVVFALTAHGVVSAGKRIVIDPCGAFDLRRGNADIVDQAAAMLDDKLPAAGFATEDVDLVINTHIDGVGWNVRPGADGWRPTFENASSVWTSVELERVERESREDPTAQDWSSLGPLRDADKVQAVPMNHVVTPEIGFRPSPGHTTGNVDIWIESGGQSAVIVADNLLNPIQCGEPDWCGLDMHPEASAALRRGLLEECERRNALVIGTHYGSPGAGRVRRHGDAWQLVLDPKRGD